MKYRKFKIKGYKGISDLTELSLVNESLIPIIGKNESGKTTFLEAINSFDFSNDKDNNGRHLANVENLYQTEEMPVIVAAEVELHEDEFIEPIFEKYINILKTEFLAKYPQATFDIESIKLEEGDYSNTGFIRAYFDLKKIVLEKRPLEIERDLRTKKYRIPSLDDLDSAIEEELATSIVRGLPYILYFDDFRDRVPEKILISKDEKSAAYSPWIEFIDELFKQTKKGYSVFSLPGKQDSLRRSIINEVQKHLNSVLAEEWAKYQFERRESIELRMDYLDSDGGYICFKIVEKIEIDGVEMERFFDISDRSKGFYWYFNFMVKLHFNPKKRDNEDTDTIYLLDEPGSYLHTYALNKLVEQLKKISRSSKVIYSTHFPNLLNPEFVPINSIRVSEKVSQGKILLKRLEDVSLIRGSKNSAYQPVLDALEVMPPLIDYDLNNIVLVEGISDYYSFRLFSKGDFKFFPCASASSIIKHIPFMIFLGKKYIALWDNDPEGRARKNEASELFGDFEAKRFLTLESLGGNINTRIEEYFDSSELANYASEFLGKKQVGFDKIVIDLFYRKEKREEILASFFSKTSVNFVAMNSRLQQGFAQQESFNDVL